MLYSDDRMKYIIEYLSAYKQKIELANKNGLLDNAKMFELFAEQVCKLYYNMEFHNLNNICNFPYFDLISEDKSIYVQVSTTSDVHQKIKKTLENIRDDKTKRFEKINSAYFFVLHNDSIKNVKDYTGQNQIGNISFIKEKNLITTEDIINKAQTDLNFQEQLYDLMKNDVENYNKCIRKLEEALDISKNVGINNIETKINSEYEIDRKEFIDRIKSDNYRFISIQGREGVGKTVICKKYIENEDIVLYARAERFLEESDIDKIWNLDIRKIIECLNGKKIVFLIDALEFIADAPKTKLDLLDSLYNMVQKYENAYIITSCRTSDKNAFLKLESKYNIVSYDVSEVNKKELDLLKNKYPILKKISENEKYSDLLKTPFYINIIIKEAIDIDEITDINKFREYIWNNIICLKDKQKKYDIKINEIEKTINKIVFDRAKNFTLGINQNELDANIVNALITEGIIISNSEGIRLKYDIYEDICFENYFDKLFNECKGKYENFYEDIDKIGRCVYRRYQIWMANKLLAKDNRNKFIYNLIFYNKISEEWKKQTEIGIVKSDYSTSFFEENEIEIIKNELLIEFIDVINLYAYGAKIVNNDEWYDVQLVPVGIGRSNIINIIAKNNIFKNSIDKRKIIKLCLDYTTQKKKDENISKKTCEIMKYYIEKSMEHSSFSILDEISDCLIVIFKLSNYCKEWIESFFDNLINNYNSTDRNKKRIAEIIIKFVIKNSWPQLTVNLTERLCNMAVLIWKEDSEDRGIYPRENDLYGLNDDYDHLYTSINDNIFLWNLFRNNFYFGVEWAINFINECIENYIHNCPERIKKIKLIFVDENYLEREYYGNPDMWIGCAEEHHVHTLLSDIVYNIKETMINYIDRNISSKNVFKFLEYVKDIIYKKSNNIILLTIIENIGLHYQNEFPGYAVDLISSIDIVEWDIHRFTMYKTNPQLEMLKKQILLKVGIPKLRERYLKDSKCGVSLEQYVQNIQIKGNLKLKEKCYKILDYLYSIVSNDEENATKYLQIQKMDFRNAEIKQLNENVFSIEANITGEAKKVVEEHEKKHLINDDMILKLKECMENLKEKKECTQLLISVIDEFIQLKKNNYSESIGLESVIIGLISKVLTQDNVPVEKRNSYCMYWIDGIRQIFRNKSFIFEPVLIPKLIEQLYLDTSLKVKNKIKLLVLDIINSNGSDGIINNIRRELIKYLQDDSKLSNILFNTIVKLSEDEMKHQVYNAQYYIKHRDNDYIFVPNKVPRLDGVDVYIKKEKASLYNSCKNQIIEKYLYLEKELDIEDFCINDYDIKNLSYVANCGKKFEDDLFCKVIKEIIKTFIDIKNDESNSYKHDIIDVYDIYDIVSLFERELMHDEGNYKKIIDLLFDNMDFSNFKKDSIEFYGDILNCFSAYYVGAYNNRVLRSKIEEKIKYIELKMENITFDYLRQELCKCLYLSPRKHDRWMPNEIKTHYEYMDKIFLNTHLGKYGRYDIKNSMRTIYLLKIDELLPEVMVAVKEILDYNKDNLKNKFDGDTKIIIDRIITKAFVDFSDEIKSDDDLIDAYERVLKILIELNYEKAGVLLDEFRIH